MTEPLVCFELGRWLCQAKCVQESFGFNVLNRINRCKTFGNIRNLHEGTENHMCPFTLTILPLKHFNSHDFNLI